MKMKLAVAAFAAVAALAPLFPARVLGQSATPVTAVPPILGTPFYQGVPQGATIPRVVPELSVPQPLSERVSANIKEIRITFDQPMDTALFYWPLPLNDPYFPLVRADPYWTNNNQTVVLPVILSTDRVYSIPINSPTMVFRAATGLYANPGLFRFATTSASGGSVPAGALGTRNPFRNGSFGPAAPTAVPVVSPVVGNPGGTGQSTPVPTIGPSRNTGGRNPFTRSEVGNRSGATLPNPAVRSGGFGGRLPTPTPRPNNR